MLDKLVPTKNIDIRHNVTIRVLDANTRKQISRHEGHNAATNSMLLGIGHYLTGEGVLNQAYPMLSEYIPRYISLGTMGLLNQEEDENGYPIGVGDFLHEVTENDYRVSVVSEGPYAGKYGVYLRDSSDNFTVLAGTFDTTPSAEQAIAEAKEYLRYKGYITQCPGFGGDGYDANENNGRSWFGLGNTFEERPDSGTINCELISTSFPRASISYRDIVPETESEFPKTIDVVFSAYISTGALAQFREKGKDYIYITEAGLWSTSTWYEKGSNGMLAGYRICPPDESNWDMSVRENRHLLDKEIIRVGVNQIVQVIWKIQLGSIEQLGGIQQLYPSSSDIYWEQI